MNSIVSAIKRSVSTLMLVIALVSGHVPELANMPQLEQHLIVVTSSAATDVVITERYVCQIHSQRYIKLRALERGYLEEVSVKAGQAVKKGDPMFKIVRPGYQATLVADTAEAKPAKGQAKATVAKAISGSTNIRAPFDGIVDRLRAELGSPVKDGDILTTLSDNSVVWVYFNVSEAEYLEYMASPKEDKENQKIDLVLANGSKFPQSGKISAIEAQFNNLTGNIPFRADFPNPDGLLRHGQSGTVLIHRTLKNALVIPRRSAFENLDRRYVYVIGRDAVVHRREVVIENETEDSFVIKKGVDVNDRIVLEGERQFRDGDKVEYEFRPADEAMGKLRNDADKVVVTSPKIRTPSSPSAMSARSTRSATSRSGRWRAGISRRFPSTKARQSRRAIRSSRSCHFVGRRSRTPARPRPNRPRRM
jgi:membrane fusion protein (multidrug efflux system)